MENDELLTVQEVADKLKIHPKTVYIYISENVLPAIKFEGNIRVRASELDKFLSDRTINAEK